MEIRALAIPSGKSLDGELVRLKSYGRGPTLAPSLALARPLPEQTVNRPVGGANRQHSLVSTNEESRISGPIGAYFTRSAKYRSSSRDSVRWKGYPSGSSLECVDEENAATRITSRVLEAQRFPEADARCSRG